MKAVSLAKTIGGKLAHVSEEAAEVICAINKTLRIRDECGSLWDALEGFNPELPLAERETNRDWIKRELNDLKIAIALLELVL